MKNKLTYTFFIFFLLIIFSTKFCIGRTIEYIHIRENLYENNNGDLYISSFNDDNERTYISEVVVNNTKVSINKILDRETYHNLGVTRYSQDKKNSYYLKNNLFKVVDSIPCLKEEYQLIRGNLYSNNEGKLFIRMIDSTNVDCPKYTYLSKIWYQGEDKELSKVVDANSYQNFDNSNYSKDKNHVYYLKSTLEGGYFYILPDIDTLTFSVIKIKSSEQAYPFIYLAKDRNHLYFDDEILDYISFKELPISEEEKNKLAIIYYLDKK